ncbi:hypothetical protein BOQ63_002180 (plasmid) [Streptomyces viridifaciens]|nr:hypothetical protein BOQ63_002180 [Streptomyces viridifaciens]
MLNFWRRTLEGGRAATLPDFLRWAFARRVVTHERRTPLDYEMRELKMVWTAPAYIGTEQAHLEEAERQQVAQDAENAARQRKREASQRRLEARPAQICELTRSAGRGNGSRR